MEEFKPVSKAEIEDLVSNILCKKFGMCSVEPKMDVMPNKCIPVLKAGENYIQYDPQRNAYRVWAKDGTYFGVAKSKDEACKNLEPYKKNGYYGLE